jgi:hypothetical protein
MLGTAQVGQQFLMAFTITRSCNKDHSVNKKFLLNVEVRKPQQSAGDEL